jgi:hypothetical protein
VPTGQPHRWLHLDHEIVEPEAFTSVAPDLTTFLELLRP